MLNLTAPAGSNHTPVYRLPRAHLPGFAWSILTRRPRSFAHDALTVLGELDPPARIVGAEHIPREGPCLVTCNHYTRPGFGSWWLVLSVTAPIAARRAPQADRHIHWIIAATWTYPRHDWRHHVVTPLMYRVVARIAHVYDFLTMPPMPPQPDQVEERAAAVRRTLRLGRELARTGGMLGLAPEGGDLPGGPRPGEPGGGLGQPPAGVGEFVTLLVRMGFPVLPVGISEPQGRLTISFGEPFVPEIPPDKARRDGSVTRQVMDAIARQLDGA